MPIRAGAFGMTPLMSKNIMNTSRRDVIKYMSATTVALGAVTSILPVIPPAAMATVTPVARLGSITGNDPTDYSNFGQWLGRKPKLAQLYFNQSSAWALSSSVSYICQQGEAFMAEGAQILWSVPCPGAKQLEAIYAGSYDSLYTNLFQSILAVSPSDNSPILARLPWEFNLASQENAAIDRNGRVNANIFMKAWIRIATIAKSVSPRFCRIWCPNVTTMSLDPFTCWPGMNYVEIIAQDFYMQRAYNKPGDFSWFRDEARGLQWGADFARLKGKPYALSEWGMNSDIFVDDFNSTASWLIGLGAKLHHHCWWDRPEVIDCRISNGMNPGLGTAYKSRFA